MEQKIRTENSNELVKKSPRLPMGQHLVQNFPVLDLGFQPDFNEKTWQLKVYGEVKEPKTFSYSELLKLPKSYLTSDFHCVTSWSRFDVKWAGVKFLDLLKIVKPLDRAKFVVFECADDYTTNVHLDELKKDNVIIAYELEGKPVPQEHGWPLRPIIPSLYGWKSAKFLRAIRFMEKDEAGYWEVRGYHNHGDPWKEERYS